MKDIFERERAGEIISLLAANAVVTRDVAANTIVEGASTKIRRKRFRNRV